MAKAMYYVWDLSKALHREFFRWLYICTVVYGPAAFATKLALLLFITRVFAVKERVSKALRWLKTVAIVYSGIQIPKVMVYACFGLLRNHGQRGLQGVNRRDPDCLKPIAHAHRRHVCSCTNRLHHPHRSVPFGLIYLLAFYRAQDADNIATERRRSRVSIFAVRVYDICPRDSRLSSKDTTCLAIHCTVGPV